MAERSISQLVKDIKADAVALGQEEVALAKREVTAGAKKLGIGGGLAATALFLFFLSSFMAIFAGAAAFHEVLNWPWWASFLIVFGILVVIASILAAIASPMLKKSNPTPNAAIQGAKSASSSLVRAMKNPSGPRV